MSTMKEAKEEPDTSKPDKPKAPRRRRYKLFIAIPVAVVAVLATMASFVYAASPAVIRSPKMEHYHFRMQLLVDGQAVNFGTEKFQTPYEKGQCSADLSAEPIHFHDGKDQFVHIHWSGMSGGMVLKNYGWNFVGGKGNLLGYRLDDLPRVKGVPTHGNQLPAVPDGASFWVYTGDDHSYQKRSFDEFKKQDLETFFKKNSNFMSYTPAGGNLLSWLFPKAAAHGTESHSGTPTATEAELERLTRINNLIGNVVIFVQPNEPSDQQIKERFASLTPLSDSTCGG
jgi:hypothetical protein